MTYAAIDFGTSNSAVSLGHQGQQRLVPLEQGRDTLPTAIFFNAEESRISYGRQAMDEYQAGYAGRLMRSLKSLLGSELINETTLVNGKPLAYRDIIGQFLSHLKQQAETAAGAEVRQLVLGRPVHFVDDDLERDRQAEATLAGIAREVGFDTPSFQFEPIAAALDYEAQLQRETLVLVADIGGGTSDFSLVRLGPALRSRLDRSGDVLANTGVHVAGTDFDQQLSLRAAMPQLGLGHHGKTGKPVPAQIYFELATWHKINFLYAPRELVQAETLRTFYADERYHQRLMKVLREREGHRIAGAVEDAKVAVAAGGETTLDLAFLEADLAVPVSEDQLAAATAAAQARIAETALDAVRAAGLKPSQVQALYFTGGSTGLRGLRQAIAVGFPEAETVQGDPFASVARGLGVHAGKLFR